jgi:hypothetical protein
MAPNFKLKIPLNPCKQTPETLSSPRICLYKYTTNPEPPTTQFTNLRILTLFTRPSIKNVDQMLDPP